MLPQCGVIRNRKELSANLGNFQYVLNWKFPKNQQLKDTTQYNINILMLMIFAVLLCYLRSSEERPEWDLNPN